MFLWALIEGSALFAVAMAFAGVPLWLLMAGITRIVDIRSKDFARRGQPASDAVEPKATRFGRPAKIAVFVLVGALIAAWAIGGMEVLFFSHAQFPSQVLGYGLAALSGVGVLFVLILGLLWVAVVIDMLVAHRVAGRDTKIAYGVTGLLCLVQSGLYLALAAFATRGQ
jgi:hypothetical protein